MDTLFFNKSLISQIIYLIPTGMETVKHESYHVEATVIDVIDSTIVFAIKGIKKHFTGKITCHFNWRWIEVDDGGYTAYEDLAKVETHHYMEKFKVELIQSVNDISYEQARKIADIMQFDV